ncbi:MAG: DUF2079 domain-containing protein [Pseudomonadota bacterium]|nr:DUF2079 domain-containing protein [Pseudomonadota bacterium]
MPERPLTGLLGRPPEPLPDPTTRVERIGLFLGVTLVAAGMAFVFGTLVSTSAARLAGIHTIEPYALAVHEQLVRNFGLEGTWVQTIHAGYDDAWTWSGHRALTLVVSAWLYSLRPSVLWLTELQIAATVLGAIPAALIGRAAVRSSWGLLLGGGVYLLHPAIMAVSLQDYQDLCFAVPFLTFTLWTMRAGHPAWAVLGALVGVMPREECVPLVLACAIVTFPAHGRRRHAWNIGVALLVAGVYAGLAQWLFPISTVSGQGHDTPLVNAVFTVLHARGPQDLPGLAHIESFYSLIWAPVGLLALASPFTLLPGAGLLFMHMTVPYNNGIDRYWFGHAHHIAPLLPFVVVATIEGTARLLRLRQRLRRRDRPVGAAIGGIAVAGLLAYSAWWVRVWGTSFQLAWSWIPQDPPYAHPAWVLARRLPADAIPVVSVRHAIVASGRRVSFTWEESLHDKGRGKGLGAATHLIAPRALTDVTGWALKMEGATIVDEAEGYVTIAWKPGARDSAGRKRNDKWPDVPDWMPEGYLTTGLPRR